MRCALVALLASCGGAVPALPSQGGPAWIEVSSAHFTLWTDTNPARANELVRQMEYLHQVIFGTAFAGKSDAGSSFVVALRDMDEIHAYVPDQFQAFSWPGENPLRQPVIVLAADTDESNGHVVTHELSHVISNVAIHDQPIWFAEGLAEFFETVKLDPDNEVVDVGEPLHNQVAQVQRYSLVPGPQLFACKRMTCRDAAFYTTSALVYSYLVNTHPDKLVQLEDELARGNPRAWDVTGIAPEDLDRLLRTWVLQGKHQVYHFTVKLAATKTATRKLDDRDVVATRALLQMAFHARATDAQAALPTDPTNVMLRLITRSPGTAAEARATAAAHPDDWRAWWLLVTALHDHSDESVAARAKACELARANPANMLPRGLCPLDGVPGGAERGEQPAVTE